jgi:hypothetical protein
MMIRFPTELVGEHLVSEAAVFFTEALAKLNARQFVRESGSDELPCCAKCAGCKLDNGAPLQDAKRLLETHEGHPASIVAYSMGRELARGVPCRVILLDGERLAYELDGGVVVDPVGKFLPEEKGECGCGKHEHESE